MAAGSPVLRDLFARDDENDTWFEHPTFLKNLATAKLQTVATHPAERWKWAVGMIEADWNATARYGRIEPQPPKRTPEEQAEIGQLQVRQAELDDEAWTEELIREAEGMERRLDEIEGGIKARAVYRPEGLVRPRTCRSRRRIPKTTMSIQGPIAAASPVRQCPHRCSCRAIARPRHARTQASASVSPTTCGRSGPHWSSRILPGTSR